MLGGVLLHERSNPTLRQVIGTLIARAAHADFAVGNVRLAAIDLSAVELGRVRSCRLLLDRLDVDMLSDVISASDANASLSRNLRVLHAFAISGRLQLRAAGTLSWSPDFSVFEGLPPSSLAPSGAACLMGAHYFSTPVMRAGASFTCALTGPAAVQAAAARFEDLWSGGHDVLPVVRELLAELTAPRTCALHARQPEARSQWAP